MKKALLLIPFAIALAIVGYSVDYYRIASIAQAQPAPQLGVMALKDGSASDPGCSPTKVANCLVAVGADEALAVNGEGRRATYRATVVGLVPAASATDIAYIIGSATKTVRVTRVSVSGQAGTAINTPIVLVKRSTAASGGTCAGATEVPIDSTSAAATAAVTTCTANPTLGTGVGSVASQAIFLSTATTQPRAADFIFGTEGGQPIVLRGVAQNVAVNLNGVSVSSGVVNVTFEWTEE